MTLMSVAERRTPCSDGPPPCMVSAVVLQGVAPLRDATKMAGRRIVAVHSLFSHAQGFSILGESCECPSRSDGPPVVTDPLYGVCGGVAGGAVAPRRHKRASRGWRNRPTQMDY